MSAIADRFLVLSHMQLSSGCDRENAAAFLQQRRFRLGFERIFQSIKHAMSASLDQEADVVIGQLSQEAASLEIASKLAGKGFCVVSAGFEDSVLRRAVDEIAAFSRSDRWQQVNTVIQDGLLGAEGSALVAELESPERDPAAREDGEVLQELDTAITHLGFHIEPYLASFGVEVSHRGRAVVHQAGEPGEERVPLNDKEATAVRVMAFGRLGGRQP
ncbi:hypothetical protein AK812_SmicGene13361 [Symbiodinium microadriaticum]|uniref:Uncharacterized protein n=1 Tax=Symbiodinium microadriaticum TaxID=2951 RepID=A0A1Q9E8D9_SYMMI|nr:hypothetical protein AK812_SmicGene13361 [Symbiodinium microadriaticum]